MTLASEILGRRLGLPAPLTRDLEVTRDMPVPMDDGTVLLADRWAPRGAPPGPTVLVRSPYGRRGFFGLLYGRLLAERGLPTVVQSVRGTFGSGGEFAPFDERADGLATLRWVQAQPWHSGPIGMTGSSYMGLTQWAVAAGADGALAALTPSITASQFRDQAYGGGAVSLETALSWVGVVHAQEGPLGPLRIIRTLRRLPALYGELPLAELDERVTGGELAWYRDWFAHTTDDDPYWAERDFSADVADVTAPVALVGGWHDIFLPWLLADFAALRRAGREARVVIGPWTHIAPGVMRASMHEALAWLRAHLLGDDRLLSDGPVRIWVGGAREWRTLPDWPPPGTSERRIHLQPGFGLDEPAPADSAPDAFRYDPNDPTPSLGGPTLFERSPVVDNAPLEARDDVLVYTAAPLGTDREIIGPVRAQLFVRASRPHFDVFVRICDVDADGVSRNVCDGLVRVDPESRPAGGDGVVTVDVDLWPTAHRFATGHRLRVLVAAGAHPRYARNHGTGEPLGTATELVATDLEVLHDPAHPSAVVLSVQ